MFTLPSRHAPLLSDSNWPRISSVATDSALRGDQHKSIAGFVDEYSKKSVVRFAGVTAIPEILEHRWYLSEKAGGDVGLDNATKSYISEILPFRSDSGRISS